LLWILQNAVDNAVDIVIFWDVMDIVADIAKTVDIVVDIG